MPNDKDIFKLGDKNSNFGKIDFDKEDGDFDPLDSFGEDVGDDRTPDTRKIAKKELIKGLTDTSPERIKKAIKNAVPDKFSIEYEDLSSFSSDISHSINKNFGGLKKDVMDVAANIAKLAPEGKIKSWLEARFKKQDENISKISQNRDAIIQNEISALFQASEKSRLEQEAINNALADQRAKKEETLQTIIAKDLRTLRAFTLEQGVNYQKKSLEIKFKHLAIAKDHYELVRTTNLEMLKQLNSIVKNTSLPDLVKQRQLENLSGDLKARFRNNLIDKALGEQSYIGGLKKSILDKIKVYGELTKSRIQDAKDHTDDMLQSREDMKEMIEMAGGEKAFKAQMAGKTGAGLIDWIVSKTLLKSLASKASGTKTGKKFISGFRKMMMDPSQPVRNLANKMLVSDNGFVNYAGEFVSELGDTLNVRRKRHLPNLRREDLNSASGFDFRTKVSVNKVIPGYLRMILAETYANRIKLDPKKSSKELEVHFDYSTEDFLTQKLAQASIIKKFKEETSKHTSYSRYRMEYLLNKGLKNKGLGITEKDTRDLANAIMIASQTSSKTGSAILSDKDLIKLLPSHLRKKVGRIQNALDKHAEDDDYFHSDFVSSVDNIRQSVPTFNKYIEQLFKSNDVTLLKNLGLIKFDPITDEYKPDVNGIRKLMYKQFGLDLGTVDPSKSKEAQFIDRVARKTALGVKIGKKKAGKAARSAMDKLSSKFGEYRNDPSSIYRDIRTTGESINTGMQGLYESGIDKFNKTSGTFKKMSSGRPKLAPQQVEALKDLADSGVIKAQNILQEAGVDYDHNEAQMRRVMKEGERLKARESIENVKDISSAVDAIEKAKLTNDMQVLNTAVESIAGLGPEVASSPEVQRAVNGARKYINESVKTGNDALNIIKKEKDPEKALQKFANMKDTIGKFLPSGRSSNLLIKGMGMYIGTLWKFEKWLWRNVYGKVAKGAIGGLGMTGWLGLKGLGAMGSTVMNLHKVLPSDYFRTIGAAPFRLAAGVGGYVGGGIAKKVGGLFGLGKRRKVKTPGGMVVDAPDEGWVDTRQKPKYVNGVMIGSTPKVENKKNKVLDFLKSWGSKLLMLLGPLGAFFKKFSVKGLAGYIGSAFSAAMKFIGPSILGLFKSGFSLLKDGASAAWNGIKALGSGAADLASSTWSSIKNFGSKAIDFVAGGIEKGKNLTKSTGRAIANGMATVADVTKRFIGEAWLKCKQAYSFVTEELFTKVVNGAKKAFEGAKRQISKVIKSPKIIGKVIGKLSSKMGGLLLPGVGLALLAWDIGNVVYYMVKEKKGLGSAICLQFIGFDPWDETTEVKVPNDILNQEEQEALAQEQAQKEVKTTVAASTPPKPKPTPKPKPKVNKVGATSEEVAKAKQSFKYASKLSDDEKKKYKEQYIKLLDVLCKEVGLTDEDKRNLIAYAEMKSNFDPNFVDIERAKKGYGQTYGAFASSNEAITKALNLMGKGELTEENRTDPAVQTYAAVMDYAKKKTHFFPFLTREVYKSSDNTVGKYKRKITMEDLDAVLGLDRFHDTEGYKDRLRVVLKDMKVQEDQEKQRRNEIYIKEKRRLAGIQERKLDAISKGIAYNAESGLEGMNKQAEISTETNNKLGSTNEILTQLLDATNKQNQLLESTKTGNGNNTVTYSKNPDPVIPLR